MQLHMVKAGMGQLSKHPQNVGISCDFRLSVSIWDEKKPNTLECAGSVGSATAHPPPPQAVDFESFFGRFRVESVSFSSRDSKSTRKRLKTNRNRLLGGGCGGGG